MLFLRALSRLFSRAYLPRASGKRLASQISDSLLVDVDLLHESFARPPVHFGSVNSRRLPRHQLVTANPESGNLSFRDIGEVRDAAGLCFFAPLAAK